MRLILIFSFTTLFLLVGILKDSTAQAGQSCDSAQPSWIKTFSKNGDSSYSGVIQSACDINVNHPLDLNAWALKIFASEKIPGQPETPVVTDSGTERLYVLTRTEHLDGTDSTQIVQRISISVSGTRLKYASETQQVLNPTYEGVTFLKRESFFEVAMEGRNSLLLNVKTDLALKKAWFIPEQILFNNVVSDMTSSQIEQTKKIAALLNQAAN